MDIQELRKFIEESEFTPETKQKVSVLLSGKAVLDYDTYASVKLILQQELDNDFVEEGIDMTDDPDMQAENARYETELQKVNDEVEKDVKFFEEKTQKLSEMGGELDKLETEINQENSVSSSTVAQ